MILPLTSIVFDILIFCVLGNIFFLLFFPLRLAAYPTRGKVQDQGEELVGVNPDPANLPLSLTDIGFEVSQTDAMAGPGAESSRLSATGAPARASIASSPLSANDSGTDLRGVAGCLPVSVIICAQNENANLQILLPLLLAQKYPHFEVIIVDDGSTDDTFFTLQEVVKNDTRVHVIELSESVKNKQGKKFALMMGLKGAKFDHVLLTDADCVPSSDGWIERMQANFTPATEIVLGYSPYQKTGGFLNLFIRFETMMTAANYLSFALAKVPYMGVGRNLAYHKHLFFDNKGFSSHIHLLSGDDDLFINQVAGPTNTAIMIDPGSFTYSKPKATWSEYFHQKTRHFSVGKYYKTRHKNLLSMMAILPIAMYVDLTIALTHHDLWAPALIVFGFHFLVLLSVMIPIAQKLEDRVLGYLSPLLYFFYHAYLVLLNVSGLFYKARTWK